MAKHRILPLLLAAGAYSACAVLPAAAQTSFDTAVGQWVSPSNVASGEGSILSITALSVDRIDSDTILYAYRLTNGGNHGRFKLSTDAIVGSRDFNLVIEALVFDNGNGIYEPGMDMRRPLETLTPYLAANDSLTVFIIARAPKYVEIDTIGKIRLTADSEPVSGASSGSLDKAIDDVAELVGSVSIVGRGAGANFITPLTSRRVPQLDLGDDADASFSGDLPQNRLPTFSGDIGPGSARPAPRPGLVIFSITLLQAIGPAALTE